MSTLSLTLIYSEKGVGQSKADLWHKLIGVAVGLFSYIGFLVFDENPRFHHIRLTMWNVMLATVVRILALIHYLSRHGQTDSSRFTRLINALQITSFTSSCLVLVFYWAVLAYFHYTLYTIDAINHVLNIFHHLVLCIVAILPIILERTVMNWKKFFCWVIPFFLLWILASVITLVVTGQPPYPMILYVDVMTYVFIACAAGIAALGHFIGIVLHRRIEKKY